MKFGPTATALFGGAAHALRLSISSSGGNATSPLQYGIMFEEIDHAGDGGIYGELLRNRAFQGSSPPNVNIAPWEPVNGAVLTLNTTDPLSFALSTSIHVERPHSNVSPIGISNPGYWGIPVLVQLYSGSFYVRGNYTGDFTVKLSSRQDPLTVFASISVPSASKVDQWTQHNFTIQPNCAAKDVDNVFTVTFDSQLAESLEFNLLSLFPPTYNDRPNGLRKDLMDLVADLKPSFMRFAGGSNLLGLDAPSHWRWNDTIGPLNQRRGYAGAWQYENTNGLGLAEFLDWCEDLQMEPILALWAGRYINGDPVSDGELLDVIEDALNEIEYVTGGIDTTYGALRASHGRTEPWTLNYVEVGNEDWDESYPEDRWPKFHQAIQERYPDLNIMSSSVRFALADYPNATQDFHLYGRPDYMVNNFGFFDQLSADHKFLVGELAVLQYNNGTVNASANFIDPHISEPFWSASVAEAVYLLGLERNADKILGTTYFSLLENRVASQWAPGIIRYNADPAQDVRTTSYLVWQLFATNRFTHTLPVEVQGEGGFGPAYWVAGKDEQSDTYVFKAAVYNSTESVSFSLAFEGIASGASAELTLMTAPDAFAAVQPGNNPVRIDMSVVTATTDGTFEFELPELSVALLRTGKAAYAG